MAVFISYSRHDKSFVDQLATSLVRERQSVWVDRWELRAGDSLIQRIQAALADADGLIVVLSKASVASEWCKKELAVALTRELNERRTVVIPALLDDCVIPLFLTDKLYADFRTSFQEGLKATLEGLAGLRQSGSGRSSRDGATMDWAIDCGIQGEVFRLTVTIVEAPTDQPFTILTEVIVLADERLTARYKKFDEHGFGEAARGTILLAVTEFTTQAKLSLVLANQFPQSRIGEIRDRTRGSYSVHITARRLGTVNGKDVVLHIDGQLRNITQAYMDGCAPLDLTSQRKLETLVREA